MLYTCKAGRKACLTFYKNFVFLSQTSNLKAIHYIVVSKECLYC